MSKSWLRYFEETVDGRLYGVEVDRETGGFTLWQNGEDVTWSALFSDREQLRKAVWNFLEQDKRDAAQAAYEHDHNL